MHYLFTTACEKNVQAANYFSKKVTDIIEDPSFKTVAANLVYGTSMLITGLATLAIAATAVYFAVTVVIPVLLYTAAILALLAVALVAGRCVVVGPDKTVNEFNSLAEKLAGNNLVQSFGLSN